MHMCMLCMPIPMIIHTNYDNTATTEVTRDTENVQRLVAFFIRLAPGPALVDGAESHVLLICSL